MATIKQFEDIEAWQSARTLTQFVYVLTKEEAFSRDFGLRDQIRRAAVSVMSNIAEGLKVRATAVSSRISIMLEVPLVRCGRSCM